MKRSGSLLLALLVACFAVVPVDAAPKKKKATVKIINQSNWEIHNIYLSPASDPRWGPDQLEDEVLVKGESLTLTDIDCDTYDVKVVDEDGDECVIEEVPLCKDDSYWKITDKELLECQNG